MFTVYLIKVVWEFGDYYFKNEENNSKKCLLITQSYANFIILLNSQDEGNAKLFPILAGLIIVKFLFIFDSSLSFVNLTSFF